MQTDLHHPFHLLCNGDSECSLGGELIASVSDLLSEQSLILKLFKDLS